MSDLSKRLEKLANRGTRRGADSVLGGAVASVRDAERLDSVASDRQGSRGDLEILDVEGDDGPPAVAMHEELRPRRARRNGFAVIGIAALLGVGTLAIAALMGSGGASSPEDAVRRFADAVNHEDMLAAVAVLSPDEVRTMRESLENLGRRAQDLQIVSDAGRPLAGVDLQFDGLELGSEQLAPGFSKVVVHGGTFSAEARRDGLSPLLQRAWSDGGGDVSQTGGEISEATVDGIEPFIVVVERDGGWYVSPAYTVLEYVRVLNDLPPADFGSGAARAAELGAESPEAAVRGALEAWSARDWDGLWSTFAPHEFPLYDYREALGTLVGEHDQSEPGLRVNEFEATAETHGDTATVTVRGDGTLGDTQWSVDERCLTFGRNDGETDLGPVESSVCPTRSGLNMVVWWAPAFEASGEGRVRVTTIRRGDRWFVSPVGTLLDIVDQVGRDLDERSVYTFFGLEGQIPPDGTLVLGEPVHGRSEGLAYVYEFQGRAGQEVVGHVEQAASEQSYYGFASGGILSADGDELDNGYSVFGAEPVTLPADGTYRLVVRPYSPGDFTVILYDAANAPADVLNPPDPCADTESAPPWCGDFASEGCTGNPDGSVTCTATTFAIDPEETSLCSSANGTYPCGPAVTETTAVGTESP